MQPAFEQYVSVRSVGPAKYAPTGDGFAYLANTTGLPNLWWQPDGGGFARQLTSLTEHRVTAFAWSPDGRRIAFAADHHGDEMHQLYVVEVGNGWPRRLTDAPSVQFGLAGWTPDGRHLVATGNDREPTEMDPLLIDADSGEVRRLMTGGLFYAGEVSPDGATLAVVEFLSNTRQRVHLLDLASGAARAVLGVPVVEQGEPAPVKAVALSWRPDGAGLYALTDEGRDFTGLAFIDRATGAWSYVLDPPADVEGAAVSRGGAVLAAVVNEGGASSLRLFALAEGRHHPLPSPALPLGVVEGVDLRPDGARLVMAFASPREACNLSLLEIPRAAAALGVRTTVEQSMLGGIDPDTMIAPERIAMPSFDREVPAWLYRPAGPGPFPVAVSIHGGPEAQELPDYGYLGLYQYLLSRGIAILAPNIRGSTGYGKEYQRLIHRDWGGGELRDIEAAARYLRAQPWVDGARLAIFGASFGGFATLSALTRLPQYWAAGVDLVGPANLVTFVDSVPPFWRATMAEWVGDARRDRAMLTERSPLTHADALRAPLLVIQGKNDPRVVEAESTQLVERLRQRGVDVTYVVDDEAGHGPPGRDGWIRWLRRTAEFLEAHLTPVPA